ncbi:MAG TPA: hypothetical protein VGJ23_03295 [Gaiellaceae bacterium]
MNAYRFGIAAFAITFVGIGIALVVVTASRGGNLGYLLGPLFVALGVGRLYLLRRR